MEATMNAAIFDMDGLLLDTERTAVDAWVLATAELGLTVSEELIQDTIGLDWESTRAIVLGAVGNDALYEALTERVKRIHEQILTDRRVPVKAGAEEILRMMQDIGLPAALATSTERKSAEWKMNSAGLLQYLSGSACGNEVLHGKPEPDVYLLAAKSIGVSPECCVALEDSPVGIQAAKAAGMVTILVPDIVQPNAETLQLTDYVVKDLYEAGKLLLRLFRICSC